MIKFPRHIRFVMAPVLLVFAAAACSDDGIMDPAEQPEPPAPPPPPPPTLVPTQLVMTRVDIGSYDASVTWDVFPERALPDVYIVMNRSGGGPVFESGTIDNATPPFGYNLPSVRIDANTQYVLDLFDEDFGLRRDDDHMGRVIFTPKFHYDGSGSTSATLSLSGSANVTVTIRGSWVLVEQ